MKHEAIEPEVVEDEVVTKKKPWKIVVIILIILAIIAGIAATAFYFWIHRNDEKPAVTLNKTSIMLNVGGTEKLVAETDDENAIIKWSSDAEDIAVVEADGTVTGVEVGKATIMASAEGLEPAECVVIVTDGNLIEELTVSQNGDSITFKVDGTWVVTGKYIQEGFEKYPLTFDSDGEYLVEEGVLYFEDEHPVVEVSNTIIPGFTLEGSITADIEDGALIVELTAVDDDDNVYELAYFIIGKEQAAKIGVTGITAESIPDEEVDEEEEEEDEIDPENNVTPVSYNTSGAMLTVTSRGNTIAFFGDGSYTVSGVYSHSEGGMTIDMAFNTKDSYEVKNEKLSLKNQSNINISAYGFTETHRAASTATVNNGVLKIDIKAQTLLLASFTIGKDDAAKLGIGGVTGDTVVEPEQNQGTGNSASKPAPVTPPATGGTQIFKITSGKNSIVFNNNGTYEVKGEYVMPGFESYPFDISHNGKYKVSNNNLTFESGSIIYAYNSMFGTMELDSKNKAVTNKDGSVDVTIISKDPEKELTVFGFKISKENAKKLGITSGGGSGTDPGTDPNPNPDPDPNPNPNPGPGDAKEILRVTSGENSIAFMDDSTYTVSGVYRIPGFEMFPLIFTVTDTYELTGNQLKLGTSNNIAANNSLIGSFDFPSETAAKMKADGSIEIVITGVTEEDLIELAAFTISKADAEKLGISSGNNPEPEPEPGDTEEVLRVTVGENSITFMDDSTYIVTGIYRMPGFEMFPLTFTVTDTYELTENQLKLGTKNSIVANNSLIGSFDFPSETAAKMKADGSIEIAIAGVSEDEIIELAAFTISKEDAEKLGISSGNNPEPEPEPVVEILRVTSGENSIVFMSDLTYTVTGQYRMSGFEMFPLTFTVTDTYEVTGGQLKLGTGNNIVAENWLIGSFDFPSETTAEMKADGSIEIVVAGVSEDEIIELAAFIISKEDAEKLGSNSGNNPEPKPEPEPVTEVLRIGANGNNNGKLIFYSDGTYAISGKVSTLYNYSLIGEFTANGDKIIFSTENTISIIGAVTGMVNSSRSAVFDIEVDEQGEVTIILYGNGSVMDTYVLNAEQAELLINRPGSRKVLLAETEELVATEEPVAIEEPIAAEESAVTEEPTEIEEPAATEESIAENVKISVNGNELLLSKEDMKSVICAIPGTVCSAGADAIDVEVDELGGIIIILYGNDSVLDTCILNAEQAELLMSALGNENVLTAAA